MLRTEERKKILVINYFFSIFFDIWKKTSADPKNIQHLWIESSKWKQMQTHQGQRPPIHDFNFYFNTGIKPQSPFLFHNSSEKENKGKSS